MSDKAVRMGVEDTIILILLKQLGGKATISRSELDIETDGKTIKAWTDAETDTFHIELTND